MNSKLFVSNDASFNANLTVAGDASMNSKLLVSSDASFNAKIAVAGDASLNGVLLVSKDASFNAKIAVAGDASMNSKLLVASDASFNAKIAVAGDASLNGLLLVSSDASFNARLNVGGDVSLNNRIFVSSDASFNARLNVAGDVSLNNRIFVSSDASFNARLNVAGDVSLNNRIFVSSDASFNARLNVGGDVSLNNRLFVSEDVSINGNLFINKKFTFGQTPVTQYYNFSKSFIPAATEGMITDPSYALGINFGNNSYFSRIIGFVASAENEEFSSTLLLDIKGGSFNGNMPANDIQTIGNTPIVTSDVGSLTRWDVNRINTGISNSTIYLPIIINSATRASEIYVSMRIELIQTNTSVNHVPRINDISLNTYQP